MRLIYGVGLSDANYVVRPTDKRGAQTRRCPIHRAWMNMLMRCYSKKYQANYPTYIGCTVGPEWLSFMAFRAWMMKQDWHGKHLDKDILVLGNKIYGPSFCCFVSHQVNTLLGGPKSGDCPLGVYKNQGWFQASIRIKGKTKYLGAFTTPEEAHTVYCTAKAAYIRQVAAEQTDSRITAGLLRHADIFEQKEAA